MPILRKVVGTCALAVASVVLLNSTPVVAAQSGFELGGRVGYGVPMGETANGVKLDKSVEAQFPLWLDVGYRLDSGLMLGGFFEYGFGRMGEINESTEEACATDEIDCSVSVIRLGAQFHYHFEPTKTSDPWLGAGLGYEWLKFSVSQDDPQTDATLIGHGFEYLNLQGGIDFKVGKTGALGPFFAFSLAQYDTASLSCDGTECGDDMNRSESIDDTALHHWLFLGVRGTFVL